MKRLKILALAAGVLCLPACAGFSFKPPFADRTTYVAPRASLDPAPGAGAGAAGGGGGGAPRR